ncbi:putative two-component system response regulator [Luteibacter sp. OK325]|uniref:HD-GYP domain-containing protein n=1 Tax=Luteibacter sp. OK325 TaxID=2135670 RepID=UPI000D35330D|nr:two-component system response regulator [Luteibacter sp. OK325]PTR34071.1 putative two-component system response regulator [Luteibacter sp. OK325]
MEAHNVAKGPIVLIVDDSPDNLLLLSELLQPLYHIRLAANGEEALQAVVAGERPDIILLDVVMPGMSGFDVCRKLKSRVETRDIPVLFLTTLDATEDETRGLVFGGADYINKPINPPILIARIATHLRLKKAADFLKDKNAYLEQEVARRTQEITAVQEVTILALTSLAEARDNETGNHIRRTQHYVKALADGLKNHPRFASTLDEATQRLLFQSAPLHDIGKVGVPDSILLKPGRLTPEEYEVMKTHTTLGRDAIQRAEDQLGMDVPFLRFAKEMAYSHQERWNGSGYPEGRSGDDIPVSARLMAVADVYDALISPRVYKKGAPHEEAAAWIAEKRGVDFDPDVVDAFLQLQSEFQAIARRFADREIPAPAG